MSSKNNLPSSYYITNRGDYTSVTKVISVKLPVGLIDALDQLIEKGYFQNRSDAIREAIRKLLSNYREMDTARFDRGLHLGIR
ncbi:type II toxin-antitoxin system ParD family antitoxin [Infirmifilum lucidum]|uniref:Type II toxin-antitoxin system ParD family antitoxin n=1 Tax=Infirmifilum lucidum TaxID=2776706 RepID=A0A7L9FIB4_9CREN|nr:ribbon-helix-helix domain-containing protein [Infirmifilum lucidum]QOJ78505.1 type II toxin-antitoxin system ParD family antitoxin [Infirmifilum lucidum]